VSHVFFSRILASAANGNLRFVANLANLGLNRAGPRPARLRAQVYEGATAAEPSISDLAAFEGAFLNALIDALAAPAPAPSAADPAGIEAPAAAAPAPAAAPRRRAATPVAAAPALARPAAAPRDTYGSDFSAVPGAMAALGQVGYRAHGLAAQRPTLLNDPSAAAGEPANPLSALSPMDTFTPAQYAARTAMHEAVAADTAARGAAAPAGAATAAAAAPDRAPPRAAMHQMVADDAALRAAAAAPAAAPEPALESVKPTRARALPYPYPGALPNSYPGN